MIQTFNSIATLSLVALLSSPLMVAAAGNNAADANGTNTSTTNATSVALTDGEIKKIDTESGKMTIQHGPLINLHMPAMTMVFKAKDPSILQSLKVGDKVRFAAESNSGSLIVTTLEKQP